MVQPGLLTPTPTPATIIDHEQGVAESARDRAQDVVRERFQSRRGRPSAPLVRLDEVRAEPVPRQAARPVKSF